jgi:hypothetical protein
VEGVVYASKHNNCREKEDEHFVSPVADPLPSVVARETETGMLRTPFSWAHTVTGLALSTMENSSSSKPMFTTGEMERGEGGREREREGGGWREGGREGGGQRERERGQMGRGA